MSTGPLAAAMHGIAPSEHALLATKDRHYTATLAAGHTLDDTWPAFLHLDPDGAHRTLVWEAEAVSEGLERWVHNTAAAGSGFNVLINSDTPALVATVQPGELYHLYVEDAVLYALPIREGDVPGNVLYTDTISEFTAASGVTVDGVKLKDSEPYCDVINEKTAATGVTVDGVLLKDGNILDSVGFYDAAAPTKVVRLDAGTVTAGNTRVLTMPDTDVDLADVATNTADILAQVDMLAVATIAVADVGGGATATTLALQLDQSDNATPLTSARQVMILTGAAAYTPRAALNGNVTFDTVTAGTIAASGSGWALVTTDATGAFACNANNAVDETVYFWVATAEAGDAAAERCSVIFSNSDDATWAA